MQQLYSNEAAKRKFLTSWGHLPFILERSSLQNSFGNYTAERRGKKKVQVCIFFPLCVTLDPVLHFVEEERREADTARPEFTPQSTTARKASCQPPAEGKTTGHQTERFGKRTSQGRFQLAQRVVTAESHRGWEEEVGGLGGGAAVSLKKRGKRKNTEQKAERHVNVIIDYTIDE